MPLIFIQRYVVEEALLAGGTQYVEGTLQFAGNTEIFLSDSIFTVAGRYVLFEYTNFDFTGYPDGQSALDALVTVNTDSLTLSDTPVLTNEPDNNRIVLSLSSRATNGTQYVEGALDIADGASLYLSENLYATANTYVLFDVPSGNLGSTSLSGGTPNYLTGLNIYPLKSGRTVVGGVNGAFWDSATNQVKVTLV